MKDLNEFREEGGEGSCTLVGVWFGVISLFFLFVRYFRPSQRSHSLIKTSFFWFYSLHCPQLTLLLCPINLLYMRVFCTYFGGHCGKNLGFVVRSPAPATQLGHYTVHMQQRQQIRTATATATASLNMSFYFILFYISTFNPNLFFFLCSVPQINISFRTHVISFFRVQTLQYQTRIRISYCLFWPFIFI